MNIRRSSLIALLVFATMGIDAAQGASASDSVQVSIDNFTRAESDVYMGNAVKQSGGTGKLEHRREVVSVDQQFVIRSNRDTLYSSGIFDLEAGPVTITLPDAGARFRSMMVVNQDHYIVGDVQYRAGTYTFDRKMVGTRYFFIALRTFCNPADAKDVLEVSTRPTDVMKQRGPSIAGDDQAGWGAIALTGASRIGRFTNAARRASAMSAYHIQE